MSTDLLISVVSLISLILGALVNQLLTRKKYSAEVEKIQAEADKARAETDKILAETEDVKFSLQKPLSLTQEQLEDMFDRVTAKVHAIQIEVQNKSPEVLYQPPHLSSRWIYICEVKHDIQDKIRGLVMAWGGGWAGCSLADFDSFFEKAVDNKLISESLANEINDFYYYTTSTIANHDIPDSKFFEIQYLAANINEQLTYAVEMQKKDRSSIIENE